MKVLLDTDLGNDIDDALCLAYLLANPECDLLGVTTVTAGAVDRARLTSALCRATGRDVPIRAGAERPLSREPVQEPPFDAGALLAAWPHEADFVPDAAVNFLNEIISAHPGEITLVAIGALTNVATLFLRHPRAAAGLRSLVLMGGRYFTEGDKPEWNLRNDPEAAQVVFATPVRHLRAVGLDVTRQVTLGGEDFRARFTGPLLDFAGPWLRRRDSITFHDPLAAASIFHPICGYRMGAVEVDSDGQTVLVPDPAGPHEVAESVSAEGFFAHYFGYVQSHGR